MNSAIYGNKTGVCAEGDVNVQISNSTISRNSGYGLFAWDFAQVQISHATVTNNVTGIGAGFGSVIEVSKSLVSGNRGSEMFEHEAFLFVDALTIVGYGGSPRSASHDCGAEDCSTSFGAFVPLKPLAAILDPVLKNNGGPTPTHMLVEGSPAIDRVNDGTCPPPERDQRGWLRPRDGNGDGGLACDVGSVER
jgi:hypothetical protein